MISAADDKLKNQLRAILKEFGGRDIAKACSEYGEDKLAARIADLLYSEQNEEAIDLIWQGLSVGFIDKKGFEEAIEPMLDEIGDADLLGGEHNEDVDDESMSAPLEPMFDIGAGHIPSVLEKAWLANKDAVINNGQEDLETVVGEFLKLPDDEGFSGGYDILKKTGNRLVLRVWFDELEEEALVEGYVVVVSKYDEIFVITSIEALGKTSYSSKMVDKVFCITGALSQGTRVEYEAKIKAAGGKVGGVTKNLDYLVTNDTDTTSTKMKKVLDLNRGSGKKILIIDEDELIGMMSDEEAEEIEEIEADANARGVFFIDEVITVNLVR